MTPWPVAWLIVALAFGCAVGVKTRVGECLGPDPARLAKRWEKTGLSEAKRFRRLFDQLHPPARGERREEFCRYPE